MKVYNWGYAYLLKESLEFRTYYLCSVLKLRFEMQLNSLRFVDDIQSKKLLNLSTINSLIPHMDRNNLIYLDSYDMRTSSFVIKLTWRSFGLGGTIEGLYIVELIY